MRCVFRPKSDAESFIQALTQILFSSVRLSHCVYNFDTLIQNMYILRCDVLLFADTYSKAWIAAAATVHTTKIHTHIHFICTLILEYCNFRFCFDFIILYFSVGFPFITYMVFAAYTLIYSHMHTLKVSRCSLHDQPSFNMCVCAAIY